MAIAIYKAVILATKCYNNTKTNYSETTNTDYYYPSKRCHDHFTSWSKP